MTTLTNDLIVERATERSERRSWPDIHLPLGLTWTTIVLGLIVIVAAALRLYNIQAVGNANEYYTAAVKSMLQSFSNFFFAAAEPGGSVTVDKPPLGLWLQAFSAMIFGVNGVAVVLPQVMAGILSVPLLFRLVRRYCGASAGLIAAFALAVTPVSIAVERNNTMDATLIFALLLAAWAFIRATDTGKLRYLLLGGLLVGLGFNIKMLQAFLPLPAFFALYLFGAKIGLKRKIAHLALAMVVLLAVSFSWATVVQLTPVDQRPYIGSTQTNNVFDLVFGYNGINRLLGGQGAPGGAGNAPNGALNGTLNSNPPQPPAGMTPPQSTTGIQNGFPPPPDGSADGSGADGFQARQAQGGAFNTGQTGVLRLVTSPLANEVGWLLPFGILAIGLLVFSTRIKFPLDEKHQAAVLWGGWLVTATVFFSMASFFHSYYLSMLSVPLAALVGIGAVRLWNLRLKRPLLMGLFVVAIGGGTLVFQVYTASRYVSNVGWAILASIVLVIGSVLLIARRNAPRFATIGFVCILIGMLWVPTVWSGMTTLYTNASAALPGAYSGNNSNAMMGGPRMGQPDGNGNTILVRMQNDGAANPMQGAPGQPGSAMNTQLLAYLEANTKDVKYLVAVPSSQQGTSLVLATGRPVLYMGGFNGGDPVVDAAKMAQLVAEKKVRYVLQGGGGAPGGSTSDVTHWLQTNCKLVTDYSSGSSSTAAAGTTVDGRGPGMQATTLYQCGV